MLMLMNLTIKITICRIVLVVKTSWYFIFLPSSKWFSSHGIFFSSVFNNNLASIRWNYRVAGFREFPCVRHHSLDMLETNAVLLVVGLNNLKQPMKIYAYSN